MPESIVNFFQEGIKGFRYWDFIKMLAIMLVIAEWASWRSQQSKLGIKPSPMTDGVFIVLVGGLTLITVPEILTRLKEFRTIAGLNKNGSS